LPGSVEVPNIRVLHMQTPSPYTEFGQKGVGEGGAIGPARRHPVNDALAKFGVEICEIPITPHRVMAAIGKRIGA
jgi:carbon-monoxide dehydrogenase large subunit